MAEKYAEQGIGSLFIYVREAHPGGDYPCHGSLDQKLRHARDMVQRWDIKRPMLVDDLKGTLHRAYGALPNMTYIFSAGGTILYKASWTDERTIQMALDQIVFERGHRRQGKRVTPYYVEWMPQRSSDRTVFMEELARDVGVRAVEEFIAAVAHNGGEATAKPIREWWAEKQASGVALKSG